MKKYRKISLLMAICLIVTSVTAFPRCVSAGGKTLEFSNSEDYGTIVVNGGDYSEECVVRYNSKILDESGIGVHYLNVHLKNDGTAWYIYDSQLKFYNYYISKLNKSTGINAAQIYDDSTGSAYCYKTPSGEYYYLPSFENLKNKNYVTAQVGSAEIPTNPQETQPIVTQAPVITQVPTQVPAITQPPVATIEPMPTLIPFPVPTNKPSTQPSNQPVPTQKATDKPTPTYATSTSIPTNRPGTQPSNQPVPTQKATYKPTTSTSVPTAKPSVQPNPSQVPYYDVEPEVIKKGKTTEATTENGEVIASVTFNKKKAVVNFKIGERIKKVKKVKQAFIIGESYNYGYITKANKFVTIHRETGEVNKYPDKWKKAVMENNVAVKIVQLKGGKKKSITGF